MKSQTYLILAIVFTIIISVFAVLNVSVVEVNYLFWKGESPLIFVILFSVLLGGVLTMAVGTGKYFKLKRINKQLEKKLVLLEQQIDEQQDHPILENNQIEIRTERTKLEDEMNMNENEEK